MTLQPPLKTITASSGSMEIPEAMMTHDQITAMKALDAQGHSATQIGQLLGCGRNTVLRHKRKGFAPPQSAPSQTLLSGHENFLLQRFIQHDGNADVVRQELASELRIQVSLRTVQRALKPYRERLRAAKQVTPRFETPPGEQMQIDFGVKTVMIASKNTKVHVFVATLGYSRRIFAKAYAQETRSEWIDGVESAFVHFQGQPNTVLVDNAKAMVLTPRQGQQPAIFDERFQAFARYWDFKLQACRPYRARTKGKVERSVGYIKGNALAGHIFSSWGDLDRRLATWLVLESDHRALTNQSDTPIERFQKERQHLTRSLGKPPFGAPRRVSRQVNADAMVVLDTNHYSVPWQLIGTTVELDLTPTEVRLFHQAQPVATHPRCHGRHQRQVDKAHFPSGLSHHQLQPRDRSVVRPLAVYADYAEAQAQSAVRGVSR